MRCLLLVFGLISFGCSPSPTPDDGGTDAPELGDTFGVNDGGGCSEPEYDSGGASPECIRSAMYTCGTDIYEIDCECPTATCSCFKNGSKLKTLSYGACPSCAATSFDDGGCDFPVPVGQ